MPPSDASSPRPRFNNGSELGRLVSAFDWSQTPLGPIDQWPQSLRTAVHLVLDSRDPMWMGWGPTATFLNNDAYVQLQGYHDANALDDLAQVEGSRVLLADDNADMRQYVSRLLSKHLRVQAVSDGAAALAAIRANRPDLVLTDVMMPELDGFGLLKAIREDLELRDLPVIMLSARAGEEARAARHRSQWHARSGVHLIGKPFNLEQLARKLAELRDA